MGRFSSFAWWLFFPWIHHKFPSLTFNVDLKEHIVKQINVEWQRHRDVPLLPWALFLALLLQSLNQTLHRDEVTIRWHDNQTLQPNTSTLTLKEFYDFYTQPSMAASFPNSIPPVWKSLAKRRTPLLCINFYIDMSAVSDGSLLVIVVIVD